ncbi:MAG: hypothetical protein KTR18_03305 [Acidiferrobacterales bacterium]|nr:hypothetical protein [Acidiferrobacterales bacterium]
MSQNTLILIDERRRRLRVVLLAILLAILTLYEYPLYFFYRVLLISSNRYAEANPSTDDLGSPETSLLQFAILVGILSGVVLVFAKPKHYLQRFSKHGVQNFRLILDGVEESILSARDASILRIKKESYIQDDSNKTLIAGKYFQPSFITIQSASDKRVIFYRQKSSFLKLHLRAANRIERFLGDVRWIDKEALLDKESPGNR